MNVRIMENSRESLIKIWKYDMEIASLTYKYFEIYSKNKTLSLKLYGCLASHKGTIDSGILKILDHYVFGKE